MEAGHVIDGKYRIVRRLGVGGMGAVYEGENIRIHRTVAIKVLHAAVATKADIVQRFEREAQAAGRIGSKHIVEVLDLGNLPTGDRFMVMEYLEGESLGDRLKRIKRFSPGELVPLMIQVLDGLAAAHEAGIVHRDLKPDNIYILKPKANQREEFVKILDFGVSKFSSLDSDMSMTSTGAVMGTPYYLSPEQARGGKIDARSDVYAIGVVLYQCIAGVVPFHAESFNELLFKIALESPRPLGDAVPGTDPELVAMIDRAMAREAGGRFQSAGELRDALLAFAQSGRMVGGPGVAGHGARSPLRTSQSGGQGFGASGAGFPFNASHAASHAGQGPMGASGVLGSSGAPGLGYTGQNYPGQSQHGQHQHPGQHPGQHQHGQHQPGAGHPNYDPHQARQGDLRQSGSGGPLGRSGAPLGHSGGPLGHSGAGQGFGASGAPFGASGGPFNASQAGGAADPLGALGSFGQSLSQSGGGALGQSGGNALGQSGGAMAVTSPQPRKTPLVAALIAATLLIGGGLGGGMWYMFGGKGGAAQPGDKSAAQPATEGSAAEAAPSAKPSAQPDGAPPDGVETAAPGAEPASSAEAAPPGDASASPEASAAPATAPPRTGRGTGPRPPTTGPAKPPASGAKPPPAGSSGRVITPTL